MTTEETHPIVELTDEALQALLKRAIRDTLILGFVAGLVLLVASGWRNAAMLATGGVISAASIFEWQRLIRLFNAKLDQEENAQRRSHRGGVLFAAADPVRGGHLWYPDRFPGLSHCPPLRFGPGRHRHGLRGAAVAERLISVHARDRPETERSLSSWCQIFGLRACSTIFSRLSWWR